MFSNLIANLSFLERCTLKLGIGAVHAAKGFLDARGVQPTAEQLERIARETAQIVQRLVLSAAPTPDLEDFTPLFEACAAAGVGVAAVVCGLAPTLPRHLVN